jgi:hypothetical protein
LPKVVIDARERELEGIEALILVSRYAILERHLADPRTAPWYQPSFNPFNELIAEELVYIEFSRALFLAHGAESKLSRFIISTKSCYKFEKWTHQICVAFLQG